MAKKKTQKVKEEIKVEVKIDLDHNKTYTIVALSSPHLIDGKEYKVTGEIAEILIEKGIAKLK